MPDDMNKQEIADPDIITVSAVLPSKQFYRTNRRSFVTGSTEQLFTYLVMMVKQAAMV